MWKSSYSFGTAYSDLAYLVFVLWPVLEPSSTNNEKLLLKLKCFTLLQSLLLWCQLLTVQWMQYLRNTALRNEYWATISPKIDLWCLAMTPQPSHNNPHMLQTLQLEKQRKRERKWLRNWSSTATQQISHTHTHIWRKGGRIHDSYPKNCMLLLEGI